MEEPSVPPLSDLLGKLQVSLPEHFDFAATDTETTLAKVRLLTAAATYFNTLALIEFGGRVGPERAEGLVEQVVGAAFQTYEGIDPHPSPYEKAAMLLRGITQRHPFEDANKRTGFLLSTYYLELMGYPVPRELSPELVIALCLRVSSGELREVETIAQELEYLWQEKSA